MADELTPEVDDGGPPPGHPVERVRGFVDRARRAPGTIDEVAADLRAALEALTSVADEVGTNRGALNDLRTVLDRTEQLVWAGRLDTQGGVAAVGEELQRVHRHIDDLAARLAALDGSLSGHAAALHRAIVAPARQLAAATLRADLGPPPDLVPGLSVFTLCWNHGGLLAESVRSGLAVLDLIEDNPEGRVLILDDASSDRTAEVGAALEREDERVRVIRSDLNLGLGLARTVLLGATATAHAFQLDADNVAVPSGVIELYSVARDTGAAVTYGTVTQLGPDGRSIGAVSNEPISEALFRSNYIDTMAVSDVAAFRELGGWTSDPILEHADDWAAIHRVAEAGRLIAFVPTLVGRYRMLATAFHNTVPDHRIASARIARVFDPTGRRRGPDALAGVAAVATHPATGVLWATPAALDRNPGLAPAVPDPAPAAGAGRPRVLVVASGGVANLGDEAITVRGLERVRATFGEGVAVDLVTDGPAPPPGTGPARWLGPLTELLHGLDYDDLGRLDAALAAAAERRGVGSGPWRPLEPEAYRAAVFLGGGSLTSLWSDGLIAPRALLGAALRHAGVPYACSGQGLGPLEGPEDRSLVAGLLSGAVAVSCRDHRSGELARSLPGVDPTAIAVTGDDALGLGPAGPDPSEEGSPPVLVVTVRGADYVGDPATDPARRWTAAADALATTRGWTVRALAVNALPPEPEIATLTRLRASSAWRARWEILDLGDDPRRLVTEVGAAHAVATQSFHVALFALDAGVPAVLGAGSPYYLAKAAGLAGIAGLPTDLAVGDPDSMGDALGVVTAAMVESPTPLAEAGTAVETWWTGLERLTRSRT